MHFGTVGNSPASIARQRLPPLSVKHFMKPDCGIELLFIVLPQHDHGERLLLAVVLRNSQNDVRPISRKWTKEAAIADRGGFQPVTEVARSPRVRSGKFVFSDAKKLLQQYLPIGDIAPKLRGFKKRCPKAGFLPATPIPMPCGATSARVKAGSA
jgi:hypothetical protein